MKQRNAGEAYAESVVMLSMSGDEMYISDQ